MNLKEIKELINLMNDNDLAEIEVEKEGSKIKLRKSVVDAPQDAFPRRPVEYRLETLNPPKNLEQASTASAASLEKPTKAIVSPMVGTFYRAPSPEAPAFADVGQIVEIGQVVCIIEAMKLMNEIKSEVRGKIVEVSVQNAEPVEFGQQLFAVEPL